MDKQIRHIPRIAMCVSCPQPSQATLAREHNAAPLSLPLTDKSLMNCQLARQLKTSMCPWQVAHNLLECSQILETVYQANETTATKQGQVMAVNFKQAESFP